MSRALDNLDTQVAEDVKNGVATKNMTRDQLLDYILSSSAALKAHLQFFADLAAEMPKMQTDLQIARKSNSKAKSVVIANELMNGLTGIAKARQEARYCGAVIEAMQATVGVLDEVAMNIDKLFVDKTFNLYNTKISHVAIYGVLDSSCTLAAFVESYIAAIMADKKPDCFKLQPYQNKYLDDTVAIIADLCCRMINGKMGKTFAAGILRYKQSGNDVSVLTSDNQSAAKFAKLGGEVQEADVKSGCRGLRIFRIIGDFWTDLFDKRARKQRALREQHKARVEFLQMELEGVDPNSPRYKKIVAVIKNYNQLIDRLNQELDKYYNED